MNTTRAKHLTMCTVCDRMVGAVESWGHWQAGRAREWRVSRHRSNDKFRHSGKQDICSGTGVNVPPLAVFPTEVTA